MRPGATNSYLSQAPRYLPEYFAFTSPFGIVMCIPPVYESAEYVICPSPCIPDFSHDIFHDTVLPSILRSVRLQSPFLCCDSGASFSAFSASSFVRQYENVCGGIFIGMPLISVCVVNSHLPGLAGLTANATV